jgi:hypothetical protein
MAIFTEFIIEGITLELPRDLGYQWIVFGEPDKWMKTDLYVVASLRDGPSPPKVMRGEFRVKEVNN